jgi:PRC-barrel domain
VLTPELARLTSRAVLGQLRARWNRALRGLAVKLVRAALLALAIAAPHLAAADIDQSQADARLIGMPIYTSDGVLIGQVANVETYGSNRSLVAAVGGSMAFGPTMLWIPLNWADKEEDYIKLLLTSAQVASFLGPGGGIGRR